MKDNVRKNLESSTQYIIYKMKSCPVKYKAIIPFNSKEKDEIIILMKYAHNHDRKELQNSKTRRILQKVKGLIEPLLINGGKPKSL